MAGKALVCVLLLAFGFAEARVDFEHSSIYDEFDFKGQSTVTIQGLCADSCRIYASITPESKSFAANILIQTKKFVSIADVAARIEPSSGQKLYLEVFNTLNLRIDNTNRHKDAGPLVLYVVNQAANFFGEALMYDAEHFHLPSSYAIQLLTVMSARPFTLKQNHLGMPQGAALAEVQAHMAGFDTLGVQSDACPYLYNVVYGPFYGFTMEVNGPILSLLYDGGRGTVLPGDLTATIGIKNVRQMERAGWIGSPGYHGCFQKKPYRSSLYDFSTRFFAEITSDQPEAISVGVVTNSDEDHPVYLEDTDTLYFVAISDTESNLDHPVGFNFNTMNLTISWMPDGSGDSHFMLRWNSTIIPHP